LGAGGAHEVSPEIGQCNAGKLKRRGFFSGMAVMKFVRLKVILCDDRANVGSQNEFMDFDLVIIL
jgi:hypothetical protein